ncbi:cytoplasmic protein [Coprinopsis cinerea AmutBmut pab1-1]|nr:cytoplasmic protein [Coprinopsis cinerea AmutBmut pab1-1]
MLITVPGSVHGKQGYFVMVLAILLSGVDIVQGLQRLLSFIRSDNKTLKGFWRFVVLNQKQEARLDPEYAGLVVDDPEELEFSKLTHEDSPDSPTEDGTERWANEVQRHRRFSSTLSERTVFSPHSATHSDDTLNEGRKGKPTRSGRWLSWIGQRSFIVAERSLVVAGLGQVISGIVVYTGGCRENYINGCLAHLIKGAIFWCYGLLTFARFLGSFAERGWAWNQAPTKQRFTAEFTESFVIFLYGVTNTWMERFGAKPGDPYTTKQIQHISIAVMFWFAGLVGMGIESRRVRRWLASSTFASVSNPAEMPQDAVTEPPSYRGSFNPFPALVIGVTGAAMAAHFQTYVFQVQIHQLWGNLLVGFSVLRCLTYFFLWLSPPKSILPSRPPTEALGSFFLACGGMVFMFSTEEVTIAAMRRGRDDVMMFLNVAVALTCLAFCWTLFFVGLKGYLKSRLHPNVTYRSASA